MKSAAICQRLLELQDPVYRDFQCHLVPTVPRETLIGVRMPDIRRLGKELAGTPEAEQFLKELPHQYYDENNLHAVLIESIYDPDNCIRALNAFLPYIDNWATCDQLSLKRLGRQLELLLPSITQWIASGETYTVRFAIKLLMNYGLGDRFNEKYPAMVAAVKSPEYYVNMMIAWYFATALAKNYTAILPYLTNRRLESWTHNKTIRKAIESYRITPEQKQYLRTLTIR